MYVPQRRPGRAQTLWSRAVVRCCDGLAMRRCPAASRPAGTRSPPAASLTLSPDYHHHSAQQTHITQYTGFPLSSLTLKARGCNFVKKRPTITFQVSKFPQNV